MDTSNGIPAITLEGAVKLKEISGMGIKNSPSILEVGVSILKRAVLHNFDVMLVDERGSSREAKKLKLDIKATVHQRAAYIIALRSRDPKYVSRVRYL